MIQNISSIPINLFSSFKLKNIFKILSYHSPSNRSNGFWIVQVCDKLRILNSLA